MKRIMIPIMMTIAMVFSVAAPAWAEDVVPEEYAVQESVQEDTDSADVYDEEMQGDPQEETQDLAEEEETIEEEPEIKSSSVEIPPSKIDFITSKKKTYYVLLIGNSFSIDTAQWMHKAAKTAGYNVVVGNYSRGGSRLNEEYEWCISPDTTVMRYREYSNSGASAWTYPNFEYVLKKHKWQVVILQPTNGPNNTIYDVDGTYLSKLSSYIRTYYQDKGVSAPLIGANLTWSRDDGYQYDEEFTQRWGQSSLAMYKDLMSLWENILNETPDIDFIVPTGTAVQNARTTYLKSHITRDGRHMNYGYGRFMAGMCALNSMGLDISEVKTINYPKAYAASIVHTPLLRKCAKHAGRKPFAVTNLSENHSAVPKLAKVKVSAKKASFGTKSKYTLTWTKSAYATRYIVRYRRVKEKDWSENITVKMDETRKLTLTLPKGTYYFKVIAMGDVHIKNVSTTVKK